MELLKQTEAFSDSFEQRIALLWLTGEIRKLPDGNQLLWHFARAYRNNNDGSAIELRRAFYYFNPDNVHQVKAFKTLCAALPPKLKEEFDRRWQTATNVKQDINLEVEWAAQTDSIFANQADRMCQSSTLWMLKSSDKTFRARFPTDDDYLNYMLEFGDTTQQGAHLAALRAADFSTDLTFVTDATIEDIISSLKRGKPVGLGILHRGTESAPRGGGHWIVCKGVSSDRTKFRVHDPYGCVYDQYRSAVTKGCNAVYTRQTIVNRWLPDDPNPNDALGYGWAWFLA